MPSQYGLIYCFSFKNFEILKGVLAKKKDEKGEYNYGY